MPKEKIKEKAEEIEEETKETEEGQEETTDEEETEEGKKEDKAKKKKEYEGIINIYTSFNNTIVHATDMSGKTLAKVTGGMTTKHGRLKANPTIAMFITKRITESLKEMNVKSVYVRIRAETGAPAPGPGAHAIIKSLTREGFRILNILDTTRIARGGPKKQGGRRGRRP
jgi:small subunit ribosomal protein S11